MLPVAVAMPTKSAGMRTPPVRLIVLLASVSVTSASPRPLRPSRTAVKAFGRLVRTASTSSPVTVSDTFQRSASERAALTMPVLPRTISTTAGTISATGFAERAALDVVLRRGRRRRAPSAGAQRDHRRTARRSRRTGRARRQPRGAPAISPTVTRSARTLTVPSTISALRPIVTVPASTALSPIMAAMLNTFEPTTIPRLASLLALDEGDDRRRDLGRVGGDRGQEPDGRLGQAEPGPDVVELVGEDTGGGEGDHGGDANRGSARAGDTGGMHYQIDARPRARGHAIARKSLPFRE